MTSATAKQGTPLLTDTDAPVAGTRIGRFFSRPLKQAFAAGMRKLRPATNGLMCVLAVAAVWASTIASPAHAQVAARDLTLPPGYGMTSEQVKAEHDAYWASLSQAEKQRITDLRLQPMDRVYPSDPMVDTATVPLPKPKPAFTFISDKDKAAEQDKWDKLNARIRAQSVEGQFHDWRNDHRAWTHAYGGNTGYYRDGMYWEEISERRAARMVFKSVRNYFRENPEALDRFVPSGIARLARMDNDQLEAIASAAAEGAVEKTVGKDGMAWLKRTGIDDGLKFIGRTAIKREIDLYESDDFTMFGTSGRLEVKIDDIDTDGAFLRASWKF